MNVPLQLLRNRDLRRGYSQPNFVPAYRNDRFGLPFPDGFGRLPARDELEDSANLIRTALLAADAAAEGGA